MRVSIHVLGALDVRIGDTTVAVGGPAQQALLAVLAAAVDASVPTDEIAAALWGTRLPARHRQQVQKRVHLLRARLGAEAVLTDGDAYRLSCPTDLREFTHRLARARALRDQDLAEAADVYRSALALWRGPALDGLTRLPELAARLDDLRGQATSEHQQLGAPSQPVLPRDPQVFVGRTAELASLRGPLTLVTGPPGVGKTALALRWAHRAEFPDGKLYVNLHGFDAEPPLAPDDALRTLLRALGVTEVPRRLDDQVALYRSLLAGRRVLVVLDNAASEDQVRPLLPAGPRCAAIVTSRNDLRGLVALNDAHRLALDVLSEAEACALVESLTGERAPELARLCGYLPLALRVIATSRASISDAVTALARSPLVTAAFEFSHRALPPEAARLFGLLGLVPRPSFTLRAATALLGTDALLALDELERASLVERHRRHRYRMHDLLHAYARDLVDPADEALDRLLDHYLRATDAASDLVAPKMIRLPRPTSETFESVADAADWLDDEYPNVLAAALATPPGRTWQLADALRRHLWLMGRSTQAVSLFSAGLAAAITERDVLGQATMHSAIGTAHMADDAALATTEFRRAADLYGQAGDPAGRLYALHNVSRCTGMRGRVPETLAVLRSALPLATTPEQHADLCASMAITLGYAGKLHDALRYHEEEMRYRGETVETVEIPATVLSIGLVSRQLGALDRAAAMLARLEQLASGTGASVWRLQVLSTRAALHRDTGHTASSLAALDDLLSSAAGTVTLPFAPTAHWTRGQLHSHAGRHELALTTLTNALEVAGSLQFGHLAPGILVDAARVHLSLGSVGAAREHAERALALAEELDLVAQRGRALVTLAHLGFRHLAAEALELQQESGYLLGQAEAHLALGDEDRAGVIFARFTGDADHAPAGVLTSHPCRRC